MKRKLDTLKYYIILPFVFAVLLLVCVFCWIVLCPEDTFHTSYQSVIQDKYENLMNEESPKIILVGGSNLAFGIDEKLLREKTGYPVVNMGLHAGFGGLFNSEIAKANIQEGDIVLLGYEYGWHGSGYFDSLGVDLIMSGIDSKIEMYRHIPLKKWPELIGYLPEFCKKKAQYTTAEGTYSRSSFDEDSHMILQREFIFTYYEERVETYGRLTLENVNIAEDSKEYLQEFKEYVTDKGASIYFIAPPLYDKANNTEDEAFDELVELAERVVGIEYISNPLDYIYSDEYIFDTIYHCSSKGAIKRTEQLIEDMKENAIIGQ